MASNSESIVKGIVYSDAKLDSESLSKVRRILNQNLDSPKMWCLWGDAIQLSEESSKVPLSEAKAAYQKAIELDPGFWEAHESLGFYLDIFECDLQSAQVCFEKAIAHGARLNAYCGLARVIVEQGKGHDSGFLVLRACPEQPAPQIAELREEICSGLWDPEEHES